MRRTQPLKFGDRVIEMGATIPFCMTAFIALMVFSSQVFGGDSWKEFRGPNGSGLALGANLPTTWTDSDNVMWKSPIHGRGWSSPVVDGGEVWLTTATEDGLKMSAICVDLADGSIKHDKLIFENEMVQPDFHATNSYASPSPVIEGPYVYVTFGAYGTACLNRATCDVVWQRRDLPCNHYRGAGSSPIIYEDLLIFNMDGFDHQYAVALDRSTGETIWKADREIDYGSDDGDVYKAFSTPTLIDVDGEKQLISLASMACLALEPTTGKEIWRVHYSEHSTTTRPIFDGKRLYFSTGFSKAGLMAVRVDGQGDVTQTHVDWLQYKGIGAKPTPVLVDGRLFDVTDDGILNRVDLETGEIVWKQRLGGKFSASLVSNGTYLFAFDHDNKGYVFNVADEPELVSENSLPDGCNATPAIVEDSLIVRTTTHLYRIAHPK